MVLEAVKTYGLSLQFAWGYLRDDAEVVLAAVQQVGWVSGGVRMASQKKARAL